ncbi:hypothetical protein CAPTEDRAFT_228236 [Capitella teleta]|uniref:HEAT repeat-containing protein 6 n=1 Tax=Capitella teleta TaxID=283909 RepID=R7UKP0_CAPTE|nr:hypothetical protein CAPTEDRAFT_228236 [Capitella teleta]|eukprot:ELU07074.1 hypothetical protein CAPTEDRAFT_228236 [Capitella teleta]
MEHELCFDQNPFAAGEVRKFRELRLKLLKLVYKDNEEYLAELTELLDALNSLEYSHKFVREETVGELLAQCCYLVPLANERLVSKFCLLICNLVNKQQLVLVERLETVTEYVVRGLHKCTTWVVFDLLRALGVIVYENTGRLTQYHEDLLGEHGLLIRLCTSQDENVLRAVIQCIENLTIREDCQVRCFRCLLSLLQTPKPTAMETMTHCKLLMCGLKGMQNLLVVTHCLPADALGPLLAVLKVLMFHGLPGCPTNIPLSLYPTPLTQFDPSTSSSAATTVTPKKASNVKKGKKKQAQRKKKGGGEEEGEEEEKPNTEDVYAMSWSKVSSSDSEYSDAEGGVQASRTKNTYSRVRQCAFCSFHALIKATERRVMFGYWTCFIPDSPGEAAMAHTLLAAILKDPSTKSRRAAIAVLTVLLESSRQFLMAAEDSDQYRSAPYTPFSVTLGHMIKEIHTCLLQALSSEASLLAITQIIKCLATLILNVPYQRLQAGLLTAVVTQIPAFISHRDPNICVACLTCLGSVASSQAQPTEVNALLLPPRLTEAPPSEQATASGELSWVLKICVKNTAPSLLLDPAERSSSKTAAVQPLPVRLESLQLLSQLAKSHFGVLRPRLTLIRDLIQLCFMDKDPAVQLHGAKLLDGVSTVVQQQQQQQQEEGEGEAPPALPREPMSKQQMLDLWSPLLAGPVPNLLQTATYEAVKYTLCDCLANVGPSVFALLPREQHILCLTLLLGLASDEDFHVRAAAVRALGVYVRYPCLREDVCFMADAANAVLTALDEQSLVVRAKAAWALGNLSNAIVLNRSHEAFVHGFSDMLLLKLFEVATAASKDSDRVRSNAVRALGNLLRYLPPKSHGEVGLQSEALMFMFAATDSCRFKQTVEAAIESLITNVATGTMKVRWNSCYALGNMLQNEPLLLDSQAADSARMRSKVFRTLAEAVHDCRNFKVRINAALALAVPSRRSHYGSDFVLIWQSLLRALQVLEENSDFTEFRYLNSLIEQIGGSLVHLAAILEADDLSALAKDSQHQALLLCYLEKYKQLIHENHSVSGAQRRTALSEAERNVRSLQPHREEVFLDALSVAFDDCIPDAVELKNPQKSAFVQSYD